MTGATERSSTRFSNAAKRVGGDLMLGIVSDHRRLLTALEDGWMRPLPSQRGVLMGIGAFTNELSEHSSKHPIVIRARIRPTKLPNIGIQILRDGRWVESRARGIQVRDTAIHWPGPLPTFAISELYVQTEEQRIRLSGLARSVANLDLSPFRLNVVPHAVPCLELAVDPPPNTQEFVVPHDAGPIQGALSMAVWGIPRTPPWMDVLVSSLVCDTERLARDTAEVNAPWLRQPAWSRALDDQQPDTQDCLWRAAILVLRTQSLIPSSTPYELTGRIATQALQSTAKESSSAIVKWKEFTIRILRGDTTISLDGWRDNPVGVAIQLILTRPEPATFKEWFKDLPNLPPAIAWTATVLCGLFRGYRRLDIQFRGNSVQQEVLALHALHSSSRVNSIHELSELKAGLVTWHKELNQFVLSRRGKVFAQKAENSRSKWYTADFEDTGVRDEATKLAKQHNWPCIRRELQLSGGHVGIHGPGQITLGRVSHALRVRGVVYMQVPTNAPLREILNAGDFLRLISVEGGPIPEPPKSRMRRFQVQIGAVPGLKYVQDFISLEEEQRLMHTIDQSAWDTDSLGLRVQQYGWKYDCKDRNVDIGNRLGPLLGWAEILALRLFSSMLLDHLPDQVIVNDYREDQSISEHIEKPHMFAEGIAMITLNESLEMIFCPPDGHEKVTQSLNRRSVAIMKGDARYKWTHEMPKKMNEPSKIRRGRRVLLTFRTVVVPT